jgi:hypothetical protein
MKFKHSVVSIELLISQIKSGKLDLQPNFQRGEVWAESKQQRLIDSILRRWYVPPIHTVHIADGPNREVLDGQQRLRAIFDFANNLFPVNAAIDPENHKFKDLHGLTYSELPRAYREKFDSFKITVFTLVDYEPAEPGELFFRLNQPATLTTAEQRNAFYGNSRDQVKKWVQMFTDGGINKDVIGFSNKRMAYDDTLARVALSIEFKTLNTKVTADDLVRMYRSAKGYAQSTDRRITRAIDIFCRGKEYFDAQIRFNKATLYSWLIFIVRANEKIDRAGTRLLPEIFGHYVSEFWRNLQYIYFDSGSQQSFWGTSKDRRLLQFFDDRATSRVADVSSVILRDVVIWYYLNRFFEGIKSSENTKFRKEIRRELALAENIYRNASNASPFDEDALERAATDQNWGAFV